MILILFYRLLSDVRLEAQFNDLPLIYTHDLYEITFHLIFISANWFKFFLLFFFLFLFTKNVRKYIIEAPVLFESIYSNKLKASWKDLVGFLLKFLVVSLFF